MSRQFGNRPPVNASLIREGRMIFQQLSQIFGDRQQRPSNFNDVLIAQAAAKEAKSQVLKCVVCLSSASTTARDADTISKGDAVCAPHLVEQERS